MRRGGFHGLCLDRQCEHVHLALECIVSDGEKTIIYVQTSGVEDPERAATAIYLASAACAMDIEAGIYFTQFGPTLLKKGAAEETKIKK